MTRFGSTAQPTPPKRTAEGENERLKTSNRFSPTTLDRGEKILYHQIHPAKVSTDVVTSLISLYFFWYHQIIIGFVIGVLPSLLVSFVIIRFASLERYKQSALGRYVGRYMSSKMQGLRFLGQLIAWIGAWLQWAYLVLAGLFVILLGWSRGKILPNK